MGAGQAKQFQWPDYLVLSIALGISLIIGFYHGIIGRRKTTVQDYLLADRKLNWFPVGVSIFVTFISVVSFTGVTAEGYAHGIGYGWMCLGLVFSSLITAYVFVPLLYPLQLTSSYEYLERRFKSKAVRVIGSTAGILSSVVYAAVITYATADILTSFSGFPFWAAITIISGLATIYTSLGGLRAVIWTDVFQCIILTIGLFAILIQGCIEVGGISNVWKIGKAGQRLENPSFNPDPREYYTMWSLVIGGTFSALSISGVQQPTVQRFSAVPSISLARRTVLLAAPGSVATTFIGCCTGIVVYAYYQNIRCDPLLNGDIVNVNQVAPFFVRDVLSVIPGFSGLYVAAICCATLSTLSSSLNSLSAMIWEDILRDKLRNLSERSVTVLLKFSVFIIGIILVLAALLFAHVKGTFIQILYSLMGATGGPLLGLFILGAALPQANWIGAFTGISVSMVTCFCLAFGSMFLSPVPGLPPASVAGCPVAHHHGNISSIFVNSTSDSITLIAGNMTFVGDGNAIGGNNFTETESLAWWMSLLRISRLYYSLIGVSICFLVGITVSLLTESSAPSTVEPELLFSVSRKILSCRQTLSEVRSEIQSVQTAGNSSPVKLTQEKETELRESKKAEIKV